MRLFLLILVLLAACTAGQPSSDSDNQTADSSGIIVSAQTDRTSAALDETIRFTLSAVYPSHVKLHLPEVGDQIAGLRIVDFGESGPSPVDNRLVVKKWFDLQGDVSGAYIIPAMILRAIDRAETKDIITPQIFINIGASSSRFDNATMQDIIDIKPPAGVARNLQPFIIAGAVIAALVLVGIFVWLYIRKRRAAADTEPPKPAYVLAYEQLEELEREHLIEQGKVQKYYVLLSDIFRQYLQNCFAIPAIEQTTQELLRSIKKLPDMPATVKNTTRSFLLHADLVKFAKYHPEEHDIQHSLQQVRDSIDQTRQDLQGADQDLYGKSKPGKEAQRQ